MVIRNCPLSFDHLHGRGDLASESPALCFPWADDPDLSMPLSLPSNEDVNFPFFPGVISSMSGFRGAGVVTGSEARVVGGAAVGGKFAPRRANNSEET